MTWGKELWDKLDLISSHTHQGIEFVDKVSKFVKERCRIEAEYAKELRKLAKSFSPKKKEEDDQIYSFHRAFVGIVQETDDIAGQHETIAENLLVNVRKGLQTLHGELIVERKQHLSEGRKVQQALEESMRALDVAKKAYKNASQESESALLAFQKADQDMTMTKLQVEKFKNLSIEKGQAADRAKDEYRNQLDKTNTKQTLHYNTEMPVVFDQLQAMEERRIKKVGELFTEYSDVECKVMPIVQTCLNNIKTNGSSVDGSKDSLTLIDQNKSALVPPGDIPFEEYGKPQPHPGTVGKGATLDHNKKKKTGGGIFGKKKKKHTDSGTDGNDFQTLTPGEKTRRCKKKVNELESQAGQLKASRDAMEKMVGVYQQNPSLGDPNTIQQQLNENGKELDAVNVELHKFQCYLAALENRNAPPAPLKYSQPSKVMPPAAPDEPVPPPPSAHEELPPPPPPEVDQEQVDEEDGEFDEIRCKTLYDFQATNDGEVGMTAGEELIVLEMDSDGSGWTKVLRGDLEGYVPTTYIQIYE